MSVISKVLDRLCLAIVERGQRVMCERDRPAIDAQRARERAEHARLTASLLGMKLSANASPRKESW
jgi:hypothetical protein